MKAKHGIPARDSFFPLVVKQLKVNIFISFFEEDVDETLWKSLHKLLHTFSET